jgi:hypothetical protein
LCERGGTIEVAAVTLLVATDPGDITRMAIVEGKKFCTQKISEVTEKHKILEILVNKCNFVKR